VPTWLLQTLGETLGEEEALAWAEAQQKNPKVILRTNRLQLSQEDLVESLQEAGVKCEALAPFPEAITVDSGGSVTAMPGFAEGAYTVQDPAAQLVGYLAAPKPGQRVLDLCAAPGGKTTHLAELMDGDGKILAIDIHPHRVGLVKGHFQRLELDCIKAEISDGTDLEALRDTFDYVGLDGVDVIVLDAPCTGLGTLRRNPELRSKNRADLKELVALQRALLDSAAELLSVGGELTYSVCTPTLEEGRGQIREFLERHPHYTIVPIETELLQAFAADDDVLGPMSCIETWTHRHGCDSFFAVKLRRSK
jgi:16S rRNA (cytosine967-C5)-methyltransferase